jgi:hypothetical protein
MGDRICRSSGARIHQVAFVLQICCRYAAESMPLASGLEATVAGGYLQVASDLKINHQLLQVVLTCSICANLSRWPNDVPSAI